MKSAISEVRVALRSCLLLTLLLTVACGDSDNIHVAEGGIGGTGITGSDIVSGAISGFSSVIINGRVLETNAQTAIYVDEQLSNIGALKVGHVVRVDANFESNSAKRIDYIETVLGPLSESPTFNPDTLSGSAEILGQPVLISSITNFNEIADFAALNAGDVLEISGVRNATGEIVARYVELKKLPVEEYRVLGTVSNLSATSFSIENLTVDFSSADISGAELQNNKEVRVKAAASAYSPAERFLVAGRVSSSVLQVVPMQGDSLEYEGVITEWQSLSDFKINNIDMNAEGATIENGEAHEVGLNVLIEVEGVIDESSTLKVSRVEIIPLNNIRAESVVEAVNPETNTITVLGRQFIIDDKTQLEDNSPLKIKEFSLRDLSSGDWVELRAFRHDDQIILTRLLRDTPSMDVRFLGPVDMIDESAQIVTIAGVNISTSVETKYENVQNVSVPPQDFFNSIRVNDLVRARWKQYSDSSLAVDELSLEE